MKTTSLFDKKALEAEAVSDHETLEMSISSDGISHLMGTLTNLYSNPVESVFREYVSNALDSHIHAKQTKPIKVDLINKGWSRNALHVQDFGTGMDKDDIVNIYSKYASSTKRNSNEQVGAFGLGAKSALAITDRFDVVSIKDGVRLEFYIEKNSRSVGVVHFISEEKTKEANGVLVQIPLTQEQHKKMTELTADGGFFSTWDPKLVDFNGAPLTGEKNVYNEQNFITLQGTDGPLGWMNIKKTSTRSYNYSSNISLAIAGIRYDIERNGVNGGRGADNFATLTSNPIFANIKAAGFNVVINLPIGSVDLTPSREDIMLTAKTKSTLMTSLEEVAKEIPRATARALNKVPNNEVFAFYGRHLAPLGVKNGARNYDYSPEVSDNYGISYKGKLIHNVFTAHRIVNLNATNGSAWDKDWKTVSNINLFHIMHKVAPVTNTGFYGTRYGREYETVVVYGQETPENLANVKRNARSYTLSKYDNAYVSIFFIASPTKPTDEWLLDIAEVVSIDELETVGKAYRSAKAKDAALNRTARAKRPEAIHYGTKYDSLTGELEIRKFTVQEINENDVIYAHTDNCLPTGYGLYSLSQASVIDNFWTSFPSAIDTLITRQKETGNESAYMVLEHFARAFPDKLIITLPKTRAIGPITKANPNAITVKQAIEDKINSVILDPGDLAILKAINTVRFDFTRETESVLINALAAEGRVSEIEDDFTRKVFTEIATKGELYSLINIGRMMLPLTDAEIKAKPTAWSTVLSVFSKEGKVNMDGWGKKFRFINASGTQGHETRVLVALVNAVDETA